MRTPKSVLVAKALVLALALYYSLVKLSSLRQVGSVSDHRYRLVYPLLYPKPP